MIKILHGENLVESRRALTTLTEASRAGGNEVVVFDSSKISLSDLKNALRSNSLLGKDRLVVAEGLFSLPKSKEKAKILEYLAEGVLENDLVCWEAKEIKKTELLHKATIEVFKVDPLIFRFLEAVKPGNTRLMLQLLSELKQREEPETIFYMLIRQLRLLILVKDHVLEIPAWQQKKLSSQAQGFTPKRLLGLYRQLQEIDFRQKTSTDSFPLSARLDLLLADL